MPRTRLASFLGAAVLLLAACSGNSSPTGAPAAPGGPSSAPSAPAASTPAGGSPAAAAACAVSSSGGTVQATIKNFSFSPNAVTAKVGDGVTWTNEDSAPHTVTLDDGSCTSDRLSQGATVTLTFSAPGTYAFHCSVHPNMKGTVEVTG